LTPELRITEQACPLALLTVKLRRLDRQRLTTAASNTQVACNANAQRNWVKPHYLILIDIY
jgi:hypothetical protein